MMTHEPTKPRGPVMAMFNSPGPCYALPGLVGRMDGTDDPDSKQQQKKHYKRLQHRHDPRSVHPKGPAYSFGVKKGQYMENCSPGPSIYGPKFSPLMKKIYHTGPDGTPQYSISSRPRSGHIARMPGPADYRKEDYGDGVYPKPPAYTIRERTKARINDSNPAPNHYDADRMLGKTVRSGKVRAPTYIMEGRGKSADFSKRKQPGPSDYKLVHPAIYTKRAPEYSIPGRNDINSPGGNKASPAKYFHEKLNVTKTQAPRFSFGVRHSQYEAPLIINVVE